MKDDKQIFSPFLSTTEAGYGTYFIAVSCRNEYLGADQLVTCASPLIARYTLEVRAGDTSRDMRDIDERTHPKTIIERSPSVNIGSTINSKDTRQKPEPGMPLEEMK